MSLCHVNHVFSSPDITTHVIQQANTGQAVFFCDEDYTPYLDWLRQGANKHGCTVRAYVLTTNHVHLLVSPKSRAWITKFQEQYACYIQCGWGIPKN